MSVPAVRTMPRRGAAAPAGAGPLAMVGCVLLIVPLTMVLASYANKALYAVGALCGLLVLGWLLRDDVRAAVASVRVQLRARAEQTPKPATRPRPAVPGAPRRRQPLGLLLVTAVVAVAAWTTAQLGSKGIAAALGGVLIIALLTLVREREICFTFVAVSSLTFVLHKSFGPQDLQESGGAVAVYVTSFDVFVVLLYALWIAGGTFREDLAAAWRRPLVWLPLVALGLLLPSLLVAPSVEHAAAELTRMVWMYLLYCYVAIRVRSRAHVWAVLAGLAVLAAVELVVVVLQWRTGGVLGLAFLGVPTSLGERTTDSDTIGRPFGTMVHPVFMAAALGIVALVALAFAIELRRSLTKFAAIGVTAGCLACMWISQTRASFVAAMAAGAIVGAVGVLRGRVRWRTVGQLALLGMIGVAVAWPQIRAKLKANFGTGHYREEIASRVQLNDIAVKVFTDHPLVGVGLNNFEVVLPRYEANPVIFFGHPVHNLYLLYLAETGVVGALGVAVLGVALVVAAVRLGRTDDRLLAGVGIGSAGAMVFLMVEELLGFSLRQDIPLALYWLLAGLVVACLAMAAADPTAYPARVRRPTPPRATPTARAARLTRATAIGATAVLVAALLPMLPLRGAAPQTAAAATPTSTPCNPSAPQAGALPYTPGLTLTAYDRRTGVQGIYVARANGTDEVRITPADGRNYNWPRFAFGNTKLVYTVRKGKSGSPEDICLMNLDGSGSQVLRHFAYRVAQPIVSPNGRYVFFTGRAPFFPQVAQFRMDLRTDETINLTAATSSKGGFDADPYLSANGKHLFVVANHPDHGADIVSMNIDGTHRTLVTEGHVDATHEWFNTDPGVSHDGKWIAIASFRGQGAPTSGSTVTDFSGVRASDWYVVLQKVDGGRASETLLTHGASCVERTPDDPCTVSEMSGYVPRFLPDSSGVSFTGAIDGTRTCICAINLDGTGGRAIMLRTELAINWHDWPQAAGASTDTSQIGTKIRTSRLLLVSNGAENNKKNQLVIASPDLMERKAITLPNGLAPLEARWGPDGRTILFTADVKVGTPVAPHPKAPPGKKRRAHVTLTDLDAVAVNRRAAALSSAQRKIAEQQVFIRYPGGTVKQLTDPWIEDWRDGLAPKDVRGNNHPRMSPDGRYVVVTNTSTLTGESFLLRIDLKTGAVLNLTNGSAGALPTDDSDPAFSADGTQIAFAWTQGSLRGIYVMDAATGAKVTPVTVDTYNSVTPQLSAKGSLITYVSARKAGATVVLAKLSSTYRAGPARIVDATHVPALSPVISPEGDRVIYLAKLGKLLGLYEATTSGGTPFAVQSDPLHQLVSVDWR